MRTRHKRIQDRWIIFQPGERNKTPIKYGSHLLENCRITNTARSNYCWSPRLCCSCLSSSSAIPRNLLNYQPIAGNLGTLQTLKRQVISRNSQLASISFANTSEHREKSCASYESHWQVLPQDSHHRHYNNAQLSRLSSPTSPLPSSRIVLADECLFADNITTWQSHI